MTRLVAFLLALTLLRLVVAALVPLAPDEAYYWIWSRALAPGYLDHPPMVALWIRAGTALAGADPLGVRLLGPLGALAGSLLLVGAGEDLFPGRGAGVRAAYLLNATLVLGAGSVLMTPDTPLLLFWTATIAALARLIRTGRAAWWLAAGLAAGCAMLGDYTAGLLLAGVGLWLVTLPRARPWLGRWQAWAGLALAFAVFAPVLVWNAQHGWASFARQGGRLVDFTPGRAVRFEGELFAAQLGLASPLVFLFFIAGTWGALRAAWREGGAAAGLVAALVLVPGAVFLEHALGDRVQGNWPAVLYPAAALAGAAFAPGLRRWLAPAVGLGVAVTLAAYLQAVAAPFPLPARLDPTLAKLAGWPALALRAATMARARGAAFVASDAYDVASELAFDAPGGVAVLAAGARWRLFRLPRASIAGETGLLLRPARRRGPPRARRWRSVRPIGTLARERNGVVAERYKLYLVVARRPAPGLVNLPRP